MFDADDPALDGYDMGPILNECDSGAAVPSVVPPPEWSEPEDQRPLDVDRWAIHAPCGCLVYSWIDGGLGGHPCHRHTFAALDSGLALLRGALAQQEKE